jgi:hypothetical protein
MLELKKVSRGAEIQAHICMPCYWCWPICWPVAIASPW